MSLRIKKTVQLFSAYVIGDALGKGAIFLLIPLYTAVLSTSDFGILTFTKALQPVFRIVFSFGLELAAFRFYYVYTNPTERKEFYGSIWLFIIAVASILSIIVTLLGTHILNDVFKQIPFTPFITLTVWNTFFRVGFETIFLQYLRAKEDPKVYLILNILSFSLFIGFQVLFVVVLKDGVIGALWGQLLSTIIMAGIYASQMIKEYKISFKIPYIKSALSYGLPLIPHQFSNWGLNLSDRVILDRFVNLAQIGIYSLADQFRQGNQLISNALENATRPFYGRAIIDKRQINELPKFITYFLSLMIIISMLIIVFAPEVLILIATPEYSYANRIIPWLILSVLFQGFYWVPMNILTQLLGITKNVAWFTFAAAVVNISSNLIFVPRYGILAAAINTSVGYLLLFLFMFIRANKEISIEFEYGRIGKILLIALLFIGASLLFPIGNQLIQFIAKMILIAFFPLGLFLSGFMNKEEKQWVRKQYNKLIASSS